MPIELTNDQKNKIRRKELAILKAQQQMLEEAKKSVLESDKLDDVGKAMTINSIDTAINENKSKVVQGYGATDKEMAAIKYTEASPYYREKYEERLKAKGLDDATLRNKKNEVATATTGGIEKKSRRRKRKSDELDGLKQDVELETQLMRQSYISDDKDIPADTDEVKPDVKVTRGEKEEKPVPEVGVTEPERIVNGYDFDFSTIPDYVQYDVIPLPSDGQCYPHKIGRLPVAYLTAADENLIASPNLYRDGKIIDAILDRKILDKRVRASELCKGDRDAIVLWLRATGYGNRFPITAMHPDTGKKYNVDFDLSTLKYVPFKLNGDKDGLFDYVTESGTRIKFKVMSFKEEEDLKNDLVNSRLNVSAFDAVGHLNALQECMGSITNMSEDDRKDADDCIADLKDIIGENVKLTEEPETAYEEAITKQMTKYTVSVNGNTDRVFIEKFIDNMRAKEAYEYRTYVVQNKPGVDFNITINVPESDGGDSFTTFLTIDDSVFINI